MIKQYTIEGLANIFPWIRGSVNKTDFINALVPLHTDIELFDVYYSGNKLHRIDGPAIFVPGLVEVWYLNGRYHRRDGPAIVRADGSEDWYLYGKFHRTNGPAVVEADGTGFWYLNGTLR